MWPRRCLKQQRSECVIEQNVTCVRTCRQGAVPVEEAVRMKPPSASMFQGKGDFFSAVPWRVFSWHTNFANIF